MSDVKVEYEQTISREEAGAWLSHLARALTGDGDPEVPLGPGTVKLHVPETVRAEVEVEVEDDKVEVEIEFSWPLSQHIAEPSAERVNSIGRSGHAGRARRE